MSRRGYKSRRSFSGKRGGASNAAWGRQGSKTGAKRNGGNKKNVEVYSIYNARGKRMYIGSTNDPERRAVEHRKSGKLTKGGRLVVESKPMSRKDAKRLEARKIQGYRNRVGRLPRNNRTSDGQYHTKNER